MTAIYAYSTTVKHPDHQLGFATYFKAAHKEVLMALSFSKVMSASLPLFLTVTSFPQNEKKSCSFSSVVSGARPATWMVYADIVGVLWMVKNVSKVYR